MGEDRKLPEKEEEVIVILERIGLVRVSEDEVKLTPYGQVITVMGYDPVKRAEEMEEYLFNYSSENYDSSKMILLIMLALILFVLLMIFWMYFEELFYL